MKAVTVALAGFFALVQFYTSLASLSPTPPVGYVFLGRAGAAALVALLVAAAGVLLARLVREGALLPGRTTAAILGPWIGAAALSSLLGFDPGAGLQVVGIMLLTALFHVAVVRFYGRPGVGRALVRTYLWTGLLASLAALAMVATRRPAELWALNHGRAAGVFVTANQFAAFLIAFVFVALGAALGDGGARRLGAAAATAGAAALLATVSLAGLLGAAVAAAFYSAALGARRAAAAIVVAGAVGAGALALGPAARHNPAESLDRLRIWQAGVRVAELFPLTGVGPMAYFRVYPAVRPANGDLPGTFGALHPHDAYLSLAGETGLVGLGATLFGWLRFGRAFRAGVARLDAGGRRFAYGVAAGLVAVLVQGVFDTIGVVEMAFVWIPYTGLALAAAAGPAPEREAPV